jgi:hypothetical protein
MISTEILLPLFGRYATGLSHVLEYCISLFINSLRLNQNFTIMTAHPVSHCGNSDGQHAGNFNGSCWNYPFSGMAESNLLRRMRIFLPNFKSGNGCEIEL